MGDMYWNHPVLIVSGSFVRLALSRMLSLRELPVLVLERRSMPSDSELAIKLAGNAPPPAWHVQQMAEKLSPAVRLSPCLKSMLLPFVGPRN